MDRNVPIPILAGLSALVYDNNLTSLLRALDEVEFSKDMFSMAGYKYTEVKVGDADVFLRYSEIPSTYPVWANLFLDYKVRYVMKDESSCVKFVLFKYTETFGSPIVAKHETRYILAIRGTSNMSNIVDDINLGIFGRWSETIERGIDFIAECEKEVGGIDFSKLTVTGHSLGGALAQIIGKTYNVGRIVTFNALGVKSLCSNTGEEKLIKNLISLHCKCGDKELVDRIYNYIISDENSGEVIDAIIDSYRSKLLRGGTNSLVSFNLFGLKVGFGTKYQVEQPTESLPTVTKGVGEAIFRYLPYTRALVDNEVECINYVIASDWTSKYDRHYGEVRVVHGKEFKYSGGVFKNLSFPTFGRHSLGYFIPHMIRNDDISSTDIREGVKMSLIRCFNKIDDIDKIKTLKDELKSNYVFEMWDRIIKNSVPGVKSNLVIDNFSLYYGGDTSKFKPHN